MRRSASVVLAAVVVGLAGCGEVSRSTGPVDHPDLRVDGSQLPDQAQQRAQWFAAASPEVMELADAVYAADDPATGQLVFGIEHPRSHAAVRAVMARQGVPTSAYRIETASPIHYMSDNLRSAHRPTVGGIQIHWSQYVCTLGFNVDHAGGRSFITNSHCTNNQGTTGTTAYYQPVSSLNPTAIAIEADDPAYGSLPGCSRSKKCRYSDAARALYQEGTNSSRGVIARTTGENNGSLEVSGSFSIGTQNNSTTHYTGKMHKVGRTTGWTSGNVTNTCATVNVSGSNIQLLCQTIVQNSGVKIVGGGDSGSPVFQLGTDATLVGILWGGNTAGDLFVFSPLKNIQDELGGLTATADGTGGGTGDGGGGGGGGGDSPCIPRGNGNNCK